ncbi:hypothetical protein HAX54_015918, partial [Datura stramonium]|nr:hypothetical protein [Datura stramonium]
SGRRLVEKTPIVPKPAKELASKIELAAEDKVEQLNPTKSVEPLVTRIVMEMKLSVNNPLVEALEQMPSYAKFMKDLVTKKRT